MKNLFLCAILLTAISTISTFGQNDFNLEGNWLGNLEVSGIKLRLVLKITKNGDGYAASFDSPDQGAKDLVVGSIIRKDTAVSFSVPKFGISYEGTLDEKMGEISGTLKQGAGTLPVNFKRHAGEIKPEKRPQDPEKPYPYSEEEVAYKNTRDNNKLAGTLTLPPGAGKFPAVVLITGSGAQDRDETVYGHRPFLVLADYLTRKGIAVLRVDDRGVGGSDLGSPDSTSENFAGDVLAGIEYLKTRREINPQKIGLVGHSEGGMIAPMVAARSKDVAFIVLLAGLGQTGEDVLYTQIGMLQKARGASPEMIAQTTDLMRKSHQIVKTETDKKRVEQRINETIAEQIAAMSAEQRKSFAETETLFKSHIVPLYLTGWFRYFIYYDPAPTLKKVKIPVLALNGENDLQVASKENLDLIAAALKAGKNKDYTVKSFPKLNHLFQTSQTGSIDEYGKIEETIAPTVLGTISEWILKRIAVK